MELYLHVAGNEDPELIEVQPESTVAELAGVGDDQEPQMLWIEEQDEPLDPGATLQSAGVAHRQHVHRSRCRRVEVHVRYGGQEREESFAPSATIERVFQWATGSKGFPLTPEQRAKHVLALPGADHFLAWSVHVGSVVEPGTCTAVLELAPKERFEG